MSKKHLNYMPQLDALRAFAVLAVIIEHWPSREHFVVELNPGFLGVNFFFVLSGFLISQILLKNKNTIDAGKATLDVTLKQFIIRRALRIFPIYYITIFAFYALNLSGIREKFGWYLLYGSNYYLYKIQAWDGPLTHFWTLAIEEQFYLFWPVIILLTPKRYILRLLISISLLPLIFRLFMALYVRSQGGETIFVEILTPSCLDSFAIGALLAHHRVNGIEIPMIIRKTHHFFYMFIFVYFISIAMIPRDSLFNIVFLRVFISLFSVKIIAMASRGYTHGFAKFILENKLFIYLGKISYGIYLYHNIVPYIYLVMVNQTSKYDYLLSRINLSPLPVIENESMRILIYFIILLAISALSWVIIEKPVNNLKKFFAY